MVVNDGESVLVVHRRLYEDDASRYFVGCVDAHEAGLVRITGHSWWRDPVTGTFEKKDGARTKIISLLSGTVMLYVLPAMMDLASAEICRSGDGDTMLQDGRGNALDLSERKHGLLA